MRFSDCAVLVWRLQHHSPGDGRESSANLIEDSGTDPIIFDRPFRRLLLFDNSRLFDVSARDKLLALNLPVAEVFTAAYNFPMLTKLVLVAALLGNFTAWNGVIVSGSRILFALGRARIIWSGFGSVHPVFRSPAMSVVFVGVVATLGVFLGRSAIIPIVNFASACFALGYLLICLGVLKLRREQPERDRPYRVPGGKVTAALAVAGSVFMLFLSLYQPYVEAKGRFPLEWSFFLGWGVLGAIFWLVAKKIRGGMTEQQRRELIIESSGALSMPGMVLPSAEYELTQESETERQRRGI